MTFVQLHERANRATGEAIRYRRAGADCLATLRTRDARALRKLASSAARLGPSANPSARVVAANP